MVYRIDYRVKILSTEPLPVYPANPPAGGEVGPRDYGVYSVREALRSYLLPRYGDFSHAIGHGEKECGLYAEGTQTRSFQPEFLAYE